MADISDGGIYINSLSINSTGNISKCPKTPTPRGTYTVSIEKIPKTVLIKQEIIEDKDIIKNFEPTFHMKIGFVCTNKKTRKPFTYTIPRKHHTHTE